MGKKNNSYTASYKLKVMFRRTVREPCGTERIRNSGIKRALLEETKLLRNAKSDSRAFRGPKAGKSAYFTHPDFSAAKLEKKREGQITRVNTAITQTGGYTSQTTWPKFRNVGHY
jgi:hypothetical protein